VATRAEARDEARRLVVHEGASYAEAAAATGLPVSTVEKWGAADRWQDERNTQMSYGAQIRALKAGLLKRAMEAVEAGGDPTQIVFAWKQAEAAYPEHRYAAVAKEDPKLRTRIAIEVVEELVAYLSETDRNALMVMQGHVEPFGRRLEAKYGAL